MSSESQSIATFSVIVKFPVGKPMTIPGLSHKEAVKRAAHERAYWAGDPDVTICIEPEW